MAACLGRRFAAADTVLQNCLWMTREWLSVRGRRFSAADNVLQNYTRIVLEEDSDPLDGNCPSGVMFELEAKAAKVPLGSTQLFNGAPPGTVSPFPFGI